MINDSNGNSFGFGGYCMPSDDRKVRSLPVLFRYLVPGFEAGWPA